jgi:type I restriction enzyme M protein
MDERCREERDDEVGRVGYEINFNRYFPKYQRSRNLEDIDVDPQRFEREIAKLLKRGR